MFSIVLVGALVMFLITTSDLQLENGFRFVQKRFQTEFEQSCYKTHVCNVVAEIPLPGEDTSGSVLAEVNLIDQQ